MMMELDSRRGDWRTGGVLMGRQPTARMIRLITTARTGLRIKMSVNDFMGCSRRWGWAAREAGTREGYLAETSVLGAGAAGAVAGEFAAPSMTPAPSRSLKEPPA